MPTLVVVLVPHLWRFGRRIDRHDDPTPNREVAKEELEGNADVQKTVVVRDNQLLRKISLCCLFYYSKYNENIRDIFRASFLNCSEKIKPFRKKIVSEKNRFGKKSFRKNNLRHPNPSEYTNYSTRPILSKISCTMFFTLC